MPFLFSAKTYRRRLNRLNRFIWLKAIALSALALAATFPHTASAAACPGMQGLISRGSYAVADTSGKVIAGCNLDQALVPASIIKIATVLAAMRVLGPDYRFSTGFYQDRAGNLYIRGFGDPSLVSEEISLITARLKALGLHSVATLYVDDSAFALEGPAPGQAISDNPYDAPVGALAVNFNTIAVLKDRKGNIASGEAQTPTLPLMHELAGPRQAGRARLNICCDGADGRERSARYAGELFSALFRQGGIDVAKAGGEKAVPADAQLFYMHAGSQNLSEISAALMHSSSNFMANLIFLQLGAKRMGYPATWAKAKAVLQEELAHLLGPDMAASIRVSEGSGLSRESRVSARTMLTLLQRFRPYRDLLRQQNGLARKSGTLTGVYNLAGYLPNGRAYVIILNQPKNTRDSVLARLQQNYGR